MKILILADTMDIGGAETHVYELSRSLSSMGHRVKILSGGGRTADLLQAEKTEFEESDVFKQLLRSPAKATRRLLRVLREFKPDVVHAHTRRTLFVANLASLILPFPLVFTAHAKFSTATIKRLFTKPPAHTVAVSEDIKEHFCSVFGSENITVIENGIDSKRFCSIDREGDTLRILNVSRLDRDSSKSAELLCLIAPRLCKAHPDMTIDIVGGGNDLARISLLAKKANQTIGKTAVRCFGAQSDILPFLRRSSIFVGVSRAALEAMFTNLPSIICGNEGYFGICTKENFKSCSRENFCARGYCEANKDRLFSDISEIINKGRSPSLYLRETARQRYDAEISAKKTEKVYQKAVSDFRRAQKYDAVICGYYGFGNLGDEMVLKSIKKELSPWRTAVIGAKGGGRIGRLNILSTLSAIRSSRLFILGGGSLLQNATSRRSLHYYLTLLQAADFFGKKTMLYANGLGPIHGKNALLRCQKALSCVDVASFRDTASFNAGKALLNKETVSYLTCDPALCQYPPKKVKNRILFFIRGEDADTEVEIRIKTAILRLRREISPDIETVFASMNKKKDENAAIRLSRAMPFEIKHVFFRESQQLFEAVATSKAVVSSRLHALIVTASAARPFVALCHDPKLEAFVKECELPPVLSPSLNDQELDIKLFEALKYAFIEEEKIHTHLKAKTGELTKLSERDKDALRRLLK